MGRRKEPRFRNRVCSCSGSMGRFTMQVAISKLRDDLVFLLPLSPLRSGCSSFHPPLKRIIEPPHQMGNMAADLI